MKQEFWYRKWEKNEIGFHLPETNPLLIEYFPTLGLKKGARIFLPLCGKSLDISWLLEQGFSVSGAELSAIAVDDLFKSLYLTPTITKLDEILHYSAPNIDIFVGDIFKLTQSILGNVDAVYDRAALVALPDEIRKIYTQHLISLTLRAPQLLISFEYDQSIHAGPPFSISMNEVNQHYQSAYGLTLLVSDAKPNGLKGQLPSTENVWWMKPLS
jgi:thiopurine S-methyltransferase